MALGPVESVMAVASLVTHAFTVLALVGIMPEQAETVVVRSRHGDQAGLDVVDRLPTPR
jgi:hypothetical protein